MVYNINDTEFKKDKKAQIKSLNTKKNLIPIKQTQLKQSFDRSNQVQLQHYTLISELPNELHKTKRFIH